MIVCLMCLLTELNRTKAAAAAAAAAAECSDDDSFLCNSTLECIPASFVCDGESDCDDSTDEQSCQGQ